jgi:hypothetical protein
VDLSENLGLQAIQRNEFIASLVENGYHHNPDGISMVVNIPKWEYPGTPGFKQHSGGQTERAVTGLGDTAGSLGAIGSMMSETPERRGEIARDHGFT